MDEKTLALLKEHPEFNEEILKLIQINYEEYTNEFNAWFKDTLLTKTGTCNIRDVYRFSKETLKAAYLVMCARQVLSETV